MSFSEGSDFKVVMLEHRHEIHIPEGEGTFGKREAPGARRLYVEVKDEQGNVRYQTWQQGPIGSWKRVTLYFDRYGLDRESNQIGLSFWD